MLTADSNGLEMTFRLEPDTGRKVSLWIAVGGYFYPLVTGAISYAVLRLAGVPLLSPWNVIPGPFTLALLLLVADVPFLVVAKNARRLLRVEPESSSEFPAGNAAGTALTATLVFVSAIVFGLLDWAWLFVGFLLAIVVCGWFAESLLIALVRSGRVTRVSSVIGMVAGTALASAVAINLPGQEFLLARILMFLGAFGTWLIVLPGGALGLGLGSLVGHLAEHAWRIADHIAPQH
jgi:hypothetical protein